jgi:hypothetical protein
MQLVQRNEPMLEHNIVIMFIESNHGKGHYIVINNYFKNIGFLGI